jgi:N-formylglutamate amidohydrolase
VAHFEVFRAETPLPLVVEIPHAGMVIDARAAEHTRLPERALLAGALHEDCDLGADRLWEGTEGEGITRVVARASRYVIDLNTDPRPRPRPPYYEVDPEPRAVLHRSHCGVAWVVEPVPRAEHERRIVEVFEPYHEAIAAELRRARAGYGRVCLVSAHTFHDPKRREADVVLGTRRGASAPSSLRDAAAELVRSRGLSVALEEPFQGGYALARHARPADGVFALQIEVARRLVTGRDRGPARIELGALAETRALVRALISVLGASLGA